MRLRFACVALVSAPWMYATTQEPLTWWIEQPLAKVKPADPVPNAPLQKSADISAARNEFEPFQLVLRAESKDATGIDVEFSDLRLRDGSGVIQRDNITVYLERFIHLSQPSSLEGAAGDWPDPLIPRVDRYVHERRNAFPFDVAQGRNQPLWVEVFVPLSAKRGQYQGAAHVSLRGTVQFDIPIVITVWEFSLPSTATLKSSFGLSGISVLKQHKGQYTSDDELYALTRMYEKAALLHRISIHGGSGVPPRGQSVAGHLELDWTAYDAEVGPFLDGTATSKDDPLFGARATSMDLRTPASFAASDQQALYWQEWIKHFKRKGWLDRLFLYLWDEPSRADFDRVLARGRASVSASPAIRNLLTTPFTPELSEAVHIWVPLVNCLERKPGSDDFCAEAPPLGVYAGESQRGKSLWFYQSCASHGCNGVKKEYFNGWPSYMIDASGAANRVMQWVAWKYRVQGELYYSMTEAYTHGDPWMDIRLFNGNGDGTLFYPGKPSVIGGHTDIPIESIRLKLIREGMEDYEYLALLLQWGGRDAADIFADRIVTKTYQWESRPDVFLAVRQEMGQTLERLATRNAAHRSNAQ
jgi:hypothetical protein